MLEITVLGNENWDTEKEEFTHSLEFVLQLEHSLISLSKWESFFKKPFLSSKSMTDEEALYYVKSMTLTPNVPPEVYQNLSIPNQEAIAAYIDDPMTATWFANVPAGKKTGEVITNELLYYWMSSNGVSKEYENWHLTRLLTLLQVFSAKNSPPKKMSPAQVAAHNAALNKKRREELGTTG